MKLIEPSNYIKAKAYLHWQGVIQAKINSTIKNKTLKFMELPPSYKSIIEKWIFKIK